MSQKLQSKDYFQVHDYDKKIVNTFRLIEGTLSQENIRLIKSYDGEMIKLSLAKATRLKHLQVVLNLSRMIDKDWNVVTKKEIDALVLKIMEMYASESGQETNTSWDHKKILKIFFRWLKLGSRDYYDVGNPQETKYIKLKKVKDRIVREDLLTESDHTKLLHACGENARDRSFIDCHFEAGTRPGEILSMKIKHVKFDSYGAILHVDGKTGSRTIRLITSTPNLATWLSVHPLKENPDAPLWIMLDKPRYGRQMTYSAAKQLLSRRARIAGLSKKIHLNLFRHTAATTAANFMTEAQMRKRHGWSSDSKMPARYVHLVNADVDDAIFEHLGIKKKTETSVKIPLKCTVCDMPNPSQSRTCSKCGRPLDLETALEIDEKTSEEKNLLNDEVARQGQAIKELIREIKEIKGTQ